MMVTRYELICPESAHARLIATLAHQQCCLFHFQNTQDVTIRLLQRGRNIVIAQASRTALHITALLSYGYISLVSVRLMDIILHLFLPIREIIIITVVLKVSRDLHFQREEQLFIKIHRIQYTCAHHIWIFMQNSLKCLTFICLTLVTHVFVIADHKIYDS